MRTILIIIALVSILVSMSACCSISNIAAHQTNSSASLYDRVIQSGKIRCGYVIYSPGCLKDPNTGKLSGIGIDALELIAEKLGLKIEWTEEVGWGSMLEGLQTNRYDMVATPVWTNANRAKVIDFSKPLFYSPIYAYVKVGATKVNPKKLEAANSPTISIATIDGETNEIIAREDFPKAHKVSLPQLSDTSQLLLNVSTGKADVTFIEPVVALEFLKNNPNSVHPLATERPVRVFANSWMFKRGQMEFKNMIDTVLDQLINSGDMDKIISKYEPAPHTLYRVSLSYQVPYKADLK